MRPTRLNFRSPKQRTGEFTYPQVKSDGVHLGLGSNYELRNSSVNKRFTSFTNEERFRYFRVSIMH